MFDSFKAETKYYTHEELTTMINTQQLLYILMIITFKIYTPIHQLKLYSHIKDGLVILGTLVLDW